MAVIDSAAPDVAPIDVALCCEHPEAASWQAMLAGLLPNVRLHAWPAACPDARAAIVWSPSQAFFDAHPRLEVVFNMGAGVDAILKLKLPAGARIVRIEDGGMAVQMAEYACHALFRHVREFDVYDAERAAGNWAPRPARMRQDFPVGVMGLGALGSVVARSVAGFGYPVLGYSHSQKHIDGVTCYAGDALDDFLAATRVLICVLPLTPATRGILRRDTLSRLRPNGYVINMARGAHLVEDDLLALLDEGVLAGAALDVMQTEPLPAGHPFWTHPKIRFTPHISAQTIVAEAIAQMAPRIAAWQRGEDVGGVDAARGY